MVRCFGHCTLPEAFEPAPCLSGRGCHSHEKRDIHPTPLKHNLSWRRSSTFNPPPPSLTRIRATKMLRGRQLPIVRSRAGGTEISDRIRHVLPHLSQVHQWVIRHTRLRFQDVNLCRPSPLGNAGTVHCRIDFSMRRRGKGAVGRARSEGSSGTLTPIPYSDILYRASIPNDRPRPGERCRLPGLSRLDYPQHQLITTNSAYLHSHLPRATNKRTFPVLGRTARRRTYYA